MTLGHKALRVYQELLKGIVSGDFPANTRLPPERELCLRFKVSRNTLRNAIARLEDEGRLESKPQSGTHVLPSHPDKSVRNIISIMLSHQYENLESINSLVLDHNCMLSLYIQSKESWKVEREKRFLEQVRDNRHLALLAFCSPMGDDNKAILKGLVESGVRVVHLEPYSLDFPTENFIIPDYHAAGYTAASGLLMRGFRKILFAGFLDDGPPIKLQYEGVLDAIGDSCGKEVPMKNFAPSEIDPNFFILRMLDEWPDHAGDLADLVRFLLNNKGGIVASSISRGNALMEVLIKYGGDAAADIPIVSVEMPGDSSRTCHTMACIEFNRFEIYRRVLEAVTSPQFREIRELVRPHWTGCKHQGKL